MTVSSFLKQYQAIAKRLPGSGTIVQHRNQAIERFSQIGFPNTKQEDWKYTNLPSLQTHYTTTEHIDHDLLNRVQPITSDQVIRFTLIDGYYQPQLSCQLKNNLGLIIAPLDQVIREDPNRLPLCAQAPDAFVHLNQSFLNLGIYIQIARDYQGNHPIEINFIASGKPLFIPIYNVIQLESEAKASIIVKYSCLNQGNYFSNHVTQLNVAQAGSLTYHQEIYESDAAHHIGYLNAQLKKDSAVTMNTLIKQGGFVRSEQHVSLTQEHARCQLNGLYFAKHQQQVDQHICVDHQAPNTTSKQLFKGVATNRASVVFNGKIKVQAKAKKIDAEQLNKNLLLSNDAQIYTKPQLEIFCDDVVCKHGATVGQLDQEALFYLRTRGLSQQSARRTLIAAFIGDLDDV
jgi:Fe-S cluster assembly protein SufD